MKAIVIGGTGFVGKKLVKHSMELMPTLHTSSRHATNTLHLDLRAATLFDFTNVVEGDVVFLTAAISAPDVCAREYDRTWEINVTGTSEFISRIIERGGRVIFFSSDTVYGEREEQFDESAVCRPAGEYAEMKHEVEKRFIRHPLFKSIRLSYVFSCEDKFTKYLTGCVQRNVQAELFHPFSRAIIHRDDVVDGALALARRWDEFAQPIINFGGPEVLSRIDFAESLRKTAFPSLEYKVIEPENVFFKNRPKIIAMKSDILPALLGRPSRTLEDAASIEFSG